MRAVTGKNHSSVLSQIVRKWEEETLFTFLQNCTDAALILPEYLLVNYSKRLKIKKHSHVSTGLESFPPKPTVVYLKGFIPPFVIKRMKWTEASGIWEWQTNMMRPAFSNPSPDSEPTRATMSGHVVVTFMILPGGFVMAMAGLLMEMCIRHFTRLPEAGALLDGRKIPKGQTLLATSKMLRGLVDLVLWQTSTWEITTRSGRANFLNIKDK